MPRQQHFRDLGGRLSAKLEHVAVAEGDMVRTPAAGDVGLEGVARAVEAVAEQLHGELALGPVAVDLVAGDVDVRARDGEVAPS